MNILRKLETPTGHILIVEGEKGKLECLSLGDYGKDVNIKCDALGLDRVPSPVRHTTLLPLTEKWVCTLSTQYGCSMGCSFCDVPKVGPGRNATVADLEGQLEAAMSLHPEITQTQRLNIHFARMGEPTWNPAVLEATHNFAAHFHSSFHIHPVVSTMMPQHNTRLEEFISNWMYIKNDLLKGEAGLQLSVNSTSESEREKMFNGSALPLEAIASIVNRHAPMGRKITLNFAVADYSIDPSVLLRYFDPKNYIVKLTPMHKTNSAIVNNIKTAGDYTEYYSYSQHEEALRKAGYDVLVFIASKEEDESRITCGNAILSDR